MSDLLGSLTMAARALEAQRLALDVVGNNIANVNTAGFSRRETLFAALPATEPWSAGNGVEVMGIQAARDVLLDRRLQQERPGEQREAAIADALGLIEPTLGEAGQTIGDELSGFFDAWSQLAAEPTSSVARQQLISQAQALTQAFHSNAAGLEDARRNADTAIRAAVDQVNDLVQRIATLNQAIGRAGANQGETLGLKDELARAIDLLSSLLDIDTTPADGEGLNVTFGNGRPLVVGTQAFTVGLGATPDGMATLLSEGTDVTGEVTGGRIGGLLSVRDTIVPGYLDRLDTMASALSEQVNALHRTGFDLDGQAGGDFFTPVAAVEGAASSLAVNPDIVADARSIAAAGTQAAGDNQVATALAALRNSRVLSGGTATFADAWADYTYRVGRDLQAARDEQQSRGEIVSQVQALRDAVSGVSLDEEAMLMTKFQRAYEANARYFRTIDTAIETLMEMVG